MDPLEQLQAGKQFGLSDCKKFFDQFDHLDEAFKKCGDIYAQLIDDDQEKYQDETKNFVVAELLIQQLRVDAGAYLYGLLGQLETLKRTQAKTNTNTRYSQR
jgi:hypothetical protein